MRTPTLTLKEGFKAGVVTDDFWYDLFLGGYILPEDFLDGAELTKVKEAISLLQEFHDLLEREGAVGYY